MLIFYYQWSDGKTHLVCVGGGYPSSVSPIWENCNTSILAVPGTLESMVDYDG
jgi:hypothetical protein